MTAADLPAVVELERVAFTDQPWSERTLAEELRLDGRYYLVAVVDARVVGYAGLADFGVEAHVMTLAVHPDWRHGGIGGRLLAALLAEADTRGTTPVLLEVAVDNPVARRLYERAGFQPVGLRRGYYEVSGTDAVVMMRG